MNHEQAALEDTIMVSTSTHHQQLTLNPSSSSSFRNTHFLNNSSSSKEWPSQINFNGWSYPHSKWVDWVDELKFKYESVWKKAGIFEAIMSTKGRIRANQDLLYGVADKWCPETNTFVFPFGEATITLEDIMVLGGYSLFGEPIFKPLEDQEMREAEQKLIHIAGKNRNKKSIPHSTSKWMDIFIGKGNEVEHEAFLATWLSVFVFPVTRQKLLLINRDPLLLKWSLVKAVKTDNVRLTLDSAIRDFIWRPYVNKCGMFYPKDEYFVTCLRVSELVGFESIEQYQPHRVAMQFGMDQDVLGYLFRFNDTNTIAWNNYRRPFSDTSLYLTAVPQGFVKNDGHQNRIASSSKYRPHAENPKLIGYDTVFYGESSHDGSKTRKGCYIVDDEVSDVQDGMKVGGNIDADGENIVDDDVPSVQDGMKSGRNIVDDDVPSGSVPKRLKTMSCENSDEDGLVSEKDVDADAEFIDDANESKEGRLSSDIIRQITERYPYLSEASIAELKRRVSRLEKIKGLKMARGKAWIT